MSNPNRSSLQSKDTEYLRNPGTTARAEHSLYNALTVEQDQERTNRHYEQPPSFFYSFTGGKWHTYSCNLWPEGITTDTESQEAKLDLLAKYMDLQPGMRILDVGCGWAGPLTYLCQKYDVRGVGLTLSSLQKAAADARIAQYGVDAQVHLCHWKNYHDEQPFDAIYTDEVIVHFHDLDEYFEWVYKMLKPNGMMVNKEVHFVRKDYLTKLTRGEIFIHETYGFSGNYRTLYEELALADKAGFELVWHEQLPVHHYRRTFDHWLSNMFENRQIMIDASGEEMYKKFRAYLKLASIGFKTSRHPTVDIVVSRKAP